METTVNERVNAVISEKKMSVLAFSRKIGMPQVTLWQQINSARAVSVITIEKILLAFEDINADWLVTGRGSMYLSQQAQQVGAVVESESVGMLRELVGSQRETISLQREKIAALEEENASLKKQHSSSCQKIASGVFSSVV